MPLDVTFGGPCISRNVLVVKKIIFDRQIQSATSYQRMLMCNPVISSRPILSPTFPKRLFVHDTDQRFTDSLFVMKTGSDWIRLVFAHGAPISRATVAPLFKTSMWAQSSPYPVSPFCRNIRLGHKY